MAEYTAIVEAGNALLELLKRQLTPEPISKGEFIALRSPHDSGDSQLTVHLFHIEEDPQNMNPGYYQYSKDVLKLSPMRLRLFFLITAHSKAPAQMREAEAHRVLGRAIQAIMDNPRIGADCLSGSLKDEEASLRVVLERVGHEQMMKIWNNTQQPYRLSIVCQVTGVSIDSKLERKVSRVSSVKMEAQEKKP